MSKGLTYNEKKAQSSFEIIIIVAVVITISISTLSKLPAISASTSTFAIMRSETLKEFSRQSNFYFVESIYYAGEWKDRNGEVHISVGGSRIGTQLENNLTAKENILNDLELCDGCTVRVDQAGI
ncbi:MAG: hypothetical protein N3F05_00050 [Candidatus Diapherotrites archaeon]|nr:hypothetical protein [Candidatus Diapherotrites archaeon]